MIDSSALIKPDMGETATALHLVDKACVDDWLKGLSAAQRLALSAQKFEGASCETAIVPHGDSWFAVGGVANVDVLSSWCLAKLAEVLPGGTYRLADRDPGKALHGWVTAQYRFDRYRSEAKPSEPRVLLTGKVKAIEPALAEAEAVARVRDLVNTPAEDMGPAQIEVEAKALARQFRADIRVTSGEQLEHDFPMVHAVGRAAGRSHAPRMIELEWGDPRHPRLAIVGKGVCFDSGGLDIKPSSAMALMKKDMGGAAHALALAGLVMGAHLKVRLHLLIPAVENAVSGNAFRPGDILKSRAGLSVVICFADSVGRLVRADAAPGRYGCHAAFCWFGCGRSPARSFSRCRVRCAGYFWRLGMGPDG